MAFLFSGGQTTDDAQNQKQNIFGGGDATQNAGSPQMQGDVVAKTSTGASSTGSSGSVSRGTSAPASQNVSRGTMSAGSGGYNPKAAQSAYSQIASSLQLPTTSLSRAQGSIQEGQQRLQDEANKYAAAGQQQAAGYKLDQDTIKGAVSGDDKAFQTTAQRLAAARPEVEAFKGLGDKLPDVSGVRDATRAYAPDAGPNYSAGQSRFDAALLRRNPEYLRMQRQILGDAARLTKESDKAVEEKTAAQRDALSKAYTESTDEIRKQLGGLGQEVVTAAQAREAEEDKRRAGLSEADIAAQEFAKLKEQIRADLKGADPRSQQYRSAQYLDSLSPAELAKYVKVDRDTDWQEFVDKSGADRYNRAMGLLGRGDMLTPSQMGAGRDYEFDQGNAYREILESLKGRQQAQDVTSQSEMDRIIAEAQARASGYNQRDSAQDAKAAGMKALAEYARGKYGAGNAQMSDLAQLHAQDLFQNPELYQKLMDQGLVRENTGADWRNVLLGSEAQKLNQLGQSLGGLEQYTEGGYRDEFENEMLQKYFDQYFAPYLEKYRAQQNPAPPPAPGRGGSGPAGKSNVLKFADVR
jgi:hypothetical protein